MVVIKKIGDTVNVNVPVKSTGTLAGTAYVRVSLVPSGAVTGLDIPNVDSGTLDGSVTLNPGQTSNVVFSGVIPAGTPIGLYNTVGIVRTGPNLTGDVLYEKTEAGQVEITGEFTVEILEMVES